ncbi:MAG: peptidylprolyl isomerase [Paludibacteraceae bacterium]|nr:peptidylprolyl isomerase [Paludibacteraceae bacterium]
MRHYFSILTFAAAALLLTSCAKTQEEPLVEFQTTLGNFTVKLYKETPAHRDNFVKLVNDGFYDGLLIHRVEKDYMMQTGDPGSKNASINRAIGTGGPGYDLEPEIDTIISDSSRLFNKRGALTAARMPDHLNPKKMSNGSQFYIIVGQTFTQQQLDTLEMMDRNSKLDIIWQKLIMANRDKIDACNRRNDAEKRLQFIQDSLTQVASDIINSRKTLKFTKAQRDAYTTVGGIPALDKEYTVFGEVVKGMDVIMKINDVKVNRLYRPTEDVRIIKAKVLK